MLWNRFVFFIEPCHSCSWHGPVAKQLKEVHHLLGPPQTLPAPQALVRAEGQKQPMMTMTPIPMLLDLAMARQRRYESWNGVCKLRKHALRCSWTHKNDGDRNLQRVTFHNTPLTVTRQIWRQKLLLQTLATIQRLRSCGVYGCYFHGSLHGLLQWLDVSSRGNTKSVMLSTSAWWTTQTCG